MDTTYSDYERILVKETDWRLTHFTPGRPTSGCPAGAGGEELVLKRRWGGWGRGEDALPYVSWNSAAGRG